MTNIIRIALGTSVALLGLGAPAYAQSAPTTQTTTTQTTTTDVTGPHSPYCGAYVGGTWSPNGNCVVETTTVTTATAPTVADGTRVPERVTGTITSVKGHLVTLQQSTRNLVVDDSRALNRQETGKVAVGRAITAHGYWESGTFYANRFETASTDTKGSP